MRNFVALAAFAASLVLPAAHASAATVQLDAHAFNGTDFTFTYGGTLAPTEGVEQGSKLVVFDFRGYVDGSIFSANPFISAVAEMTTSDVLIAPGQNDDPTLVNLVFTYNGPDFQTTPAVGTPYLPIDFTGLMARSIYGGLSFDGFATITTKNEGAAAGTLVYSVGTLAVPAPAAVPEPASWALLVLGFGAVGAAARRGKRYTVSFS